ncbi:metalloregulator ArsR/SmtB family transcription factor [Actinoplanes sp. Pm04-4]|uniref:Metalloregulator ArsR/SmtB family transcription factor n=1 Tax=Paractinoplanes pyxinae TaxID=2997416 RepID=A0ABT4B070_9ACTN|nr:metalloregulator ArsR/SmtB family transcription factor [Actinoplanes pyxinae]MCY1139892.1 metalloregulator ArsR/SmtB family transcription factor [Actinoplanes pyxinae]
MDDVVAALADPVRRQILEVLRGGPLPARVIAGRFPISRPAVSRHLRVLRECGLVSDKAEGRERVYRLDPAPLAEVKRWLAGFPDSAAEVWGRRLDALETEVYRTRREKRAAPEPDERAAPQREERTA